MIPSNHFVLIRRYQENFQRARWKRVMASSCESAIKLVLLHHGKALRRLACRTTESTAWVIQQPGEKVRLPVVLSKFKLVFKI